MTIMDVKYVYCKTREQFGKQCVFDFDGPIAIENIEPNPELRREFIFKNPSHIASQKSKLYAGHEAQTENAKLSERGMLHREGGWPREVNYKEEEVTSRIRKRIIRSENWASTVKNLMIPMEHCVKQNNAINIYENYFDELIPSKLVLPLAYRVVDTFVDPQCQTNPTPISNISWSRRGSKMIVTHCSMDFEKASAAEHSPVSYLWSIDNSAYPLLTLKPKIPSVTIEFNPRHSSLLISGQTTGQVAFWDLRKAENPIAESHRLRSHSDPASILFWIDTKTHCEFASASTDGFMKWWDIRKIREPTQSLAMDLSPPKSSEMIISAGISSLNYSHAMGTKFIVGLDNGIVINGSMKARSDPGNLGSGFKCHFGPVFSVHRNPFIPKLFMTVGDWTSRIWAEDTKESCLASTDYRSREDLLTGGCWSNSQVSVFYVIGSMGEFEVWNLLSGLNKPVETLKLGKNPLTRIKPHENGKFIAIGNQIGKIYLVESSEASITNRKNDKSIMTAYMENCKRYEKSVDSRLREIKYLQRLEYQNSEAFPEVTSTKNYITANGKQIDERSDKSRVGIDVNQNVNKKTVRKVENTTSLPLDLDLIEPENEYFALVGKELERYGNLVSEDDSDDALLESKVKEHRKRVRHVERKSYKKKDTRKKYERINRTAETELPSVSPDLFQASEINEEVIKPKLLSPKRTKSRKRSPKPCAVEVSARICSPEICCRDVKDSLNKGAKLRVKERDSVNDNKDTSPRKTRASFSAVEKVPDERVLDPSSAITPVLEVEKSKSTKFEKYYTARMAEVKDFSNEVKAEILKRSTARPSTILLEALLAKKRIDQEADRIGSSYGKKRDDGGTNKTKVTEDVVQVIDTLQGEIHPVDNNAVDKLEDVNPGSSPTVRSVKGIKMKQQKSSPKEMTNCNVIPRRALTALQVMPTEVFRPLPKLTDDERQYCHSQKESFEDRMYPGSSAFPPLPRIVLPKLLERPPDPKGVEGHEESGNGKKVKRKIKSGANKAEKSRSPNN